MSNSKRNSILQKALENTLLVEQWDQERNAPDQFDLTLSCKDKVWWRCLNGHSWLATTENRVYGQGCPVCAGQLRYKRRRI